MTDWRTTQGEAHGLVLAHADESAYGSSVQELVADRVASRLAARDASLWGPAAEEEAARRLAWVGLADSSRPLVEQITTLRDQLASAGLTRIVLCGMGGSSLAPEVICEHAGTDLVVVDSSHPDVVRGAIEDRLAETVVVVSSKSGGTVETDSQLRAFEQAFSEAGLEASDRIVVVTDGGSPLADHAQESGYRVFEADPEVGGRYSALTAFGLVPAGLSGADIGRLLDEAAAIQPALVADEEGNPALRLGALLATANLAGVDKLVLADAGSDHRRLGDWAEQLIAESTGKQGLGILPVVVGDTDEPNFSPSTPDSLLATWGPRPVLDQVDPASGWGVSVTATLGAQFLLWEHATAIAGRVLGIDPFDQPDVERAKEAARSVLAGGGTEEPGPLFTDGDVAVHVTGEWLPDTARDVASAVRVLLEQLVPDRGYLAVQAYLDRHRDAALADLRAPLAERAGRPVTFGWGPRFLHSTGQYHKGGPPTGTFLQITGAVQQDLPVPGRDFGFAELIAAQASGDANVLRRRGCPLLRLHLTGPKGLRTVVKALS